MGSLLEIAPGISINEDEIVFSFFQASGPGGQNINKVATGARLRFSIATSTTLPEEIKQRLIRISGLRITAEGDLIIESRQYRTQELNRQAALLRFERLVRRAAEPPKTRLKTRPTLASRQRRLAEKKRRGEIKRLRRFSSEE